MKIIIVAYSFYPVQSPRSYRAYELAREFVRQGHIVTVFTSTVEDYDYSRFEKETGVKLKSLGKSYFCKSPLSKSKESFFNKVIRKILSYPLNFPSIELTFNIRRVLKKEKQKADLLLSIAAPHSVPWGVAWANKNNRISKIHIADCGDPFMGNKFVRYPFYFKYIEKWFCRNVSLITVPIENSISGYYPEFHKKIEVIPQGFKIEKIYNEEVNNPIPRFTYAGLFYENKRDPRKLLDYLITVEDNFVFEIYTKSQSLIFEYKELLGDKLIIKDYISRGELLERMSSSNFLINIENEDTEVQLPSKLIDYMIAGRPVLSLNSKSDMKKVNQFIQEDYSQALDLGSIDKFKIEDIVKRFVELARNNNNESSI